MRLPLAAREVLWRFGPPALVAAVLLAILDDGRLDLELARRYFDPAAGRFPLQGDWLFEQVLHHGLKYAVVAFGFLALGRAAAGWLLPQLAPRRRAWLFVFAAMLLSTTAVSLLKHDSLHHCPWDVDAFGGFAPYVSVLDEAPAGLSPGRCFPGGHASGGFALMALFFAWRRSRPRLARLALAGALALGFLMGWARMMQGAHFLSHNLWSALVVWSVIAALDWVVRPDREAASPPLPASPAPGERRVEPPFPQRGKGRG